MKNSKTHPKESVRHRNPDVLPGFPENADTKNGGIRSLVKVVGPSAPSVPISVHKPFPSG